MLRRPVLPFVERLNGSVADDPFPGLYEQLVTEELRRLLAGLEQPP